MSRQHAITEILNSLEQPDRDFDDLVPAVYDELRGLARSQLRRLRAGGSLDTTELVHEAYLKLSNVQPKWQNRRHFFATAAKVMRHLLTDVARRSKAAKHGSGAVHLSILDADSATLVQEAEMVLAIDQALGELSNKLPRLAQVVEYRFFGGLTEEEIADLLGRSPRSVRRDWVKARAWLHQHLDVDSQ